MSKHLPGKPSYNIIGLTILVFLYALLICSNVIADSDLLSYTGDSFSVVVTKTSENKNEILKLHIFNSKHKQSSVFMVPDPERIVIDLIGATLKKNKDYALESSSLVKSMRLGAHSGKARIVLDLSTETPSSYRTTESEGELTLIIEKTGHAAKNSPVEPKPTTQQKVELPLLVEDEPAVLPSKTPAKAKHTAISAEVLEEEIIVQQGNSEEMIEELIVKKPLPTPTKTAVKTAMKTPTEIPANTPSPAILPTEIPSETTATATPLQTQLPQTQALRDIKFAYNQGFKSSPIIKLDLVNKAQFELQKSDDKTYTLTIKDCREFKPELKLVNFPPHDFAGFTYVLAEANKSDTEIRIGVERNKRITATPNENEIWISLLAEGKTETNPLPAKKVSAVQKSMERPTR